MSGAQGYHIKQAQPRTAQNLRRMMGDVSLQVSRQMLARAPKMGPESTVHDNACGNGVVTQAIIETQTPANVTIHATDIGSTMCEATAALASEHAAWASRVKTAVMPSEKLTFADDTFTHSYGNFVIFMAQDAEKVASEMFRTLRPAARGGVGYVTTWHLMPDEDAIMAAHAATRPPDAKHLLSMRSDWKDPEYVKGVMERAGFSAEMSKLDTKLSFESTRGWCELAWSLLGAPVGGWTPQDEEKFEQAVDVMTENLAGSEYFESNGKGGGAVRMIANVATVRKG
ncbi:MAG: hypothetical protein LQ340_007152 [Diploschistes diacapsis]|nr:MAG: hypothetical protein LQ340_007152 [Diploschistes diacapsis]